MLVINQFLWETNVNFIDFKKTLLDADITLPKFSKLIKVSDKNLQAYKKKDNVPNTIAVIATCFAHMKKLDIDYKVLIEDLQLEPKLKEGAGFAKNKKKKIEQANL